MSWALIPVLIFIASVAEKYVHDSNKKNIKLSRIFLGW